MLIAHYDESGTHEGSPFTVISGLAGHENAWLAFDREWNKILRKNKIEFLHAKDMWHRQKQFKGWSRRQIRELWADATYVIQEQELFMSRIILDNKEYDDFYRCRSLPTRRPLDSRYGLCFRMLSMQLPLIYAERYKAVETNFIMESGHKNAGDAVRIFGKLKAAGQLSIGSLNFVGKRGNPGVQAADLLAYDAFRDISSRDYGPEDDDWLLGVGETEQELLHSGIAVIDHSIRRENLIDLRALMLNGRRYFLENKDRLASSFTVGLLNQGEFFDGTPVFERKLD